MYQGHGHLGPLQWQTPDREQVSENWVAWGLVTPSQWASHATGSGGLQGLGNLVTAGKGESSLRCHASVLQKV